MTEDLTFTAIREIFAGELNDLPVFLAAINEDGFVFGLYWDRTDFNPEPQYIEHLQEMIRKRIVTSENPMMHKVKTESNGLVIDPQIRKNRPHESKTQ